MTKTIMILVIAAALVAGTISTATFVSAAPPENNPGKPFDAILQKLDEIIATLTGTDAEVANIEGKLDDTNTGLAAIKTAVDGISTGGIPASTQTQIDSIESDVGMIKTTVGDIDAEVTNIEGKLDGTVQSFVSGIKTETDKIQMVKDNQYVPFTALITTTATCDTPGVSSAGFSASILQIRIGSSATTGNFIITGVFMSPIGLNGVADTDSIKIRALSVDGLTVGFTRSDSLVANTNGNTSFDIMGQPLRDGGTFPHQITVVNAGQSNQDVLIGITCDAGTTGQAIIFLPNEIKVSGWKLESDTITVDTLSVPPGLGGAP